MIVRSVTPRGYASQAGRPWQTGASRYSDHVEAAGTSDNDAAQRSAFEKRAAAIRAMDDLTEAFEEAGKLVTTQLEFRHDAAQLRADVARQIQEAGDLSIGQLAKRLGLSKGRTDRLLRRAGQSVSGDAK
jgi:hypothetical protein